MDDRTLADIQFFGLEQYGQGLLPGFGDEVAKHPHKPSGPGGGQFSEKMYHGTGRDDQQSIYKHGPGSVLGDGTKYFAFSPDDAKKYGPQVSEHSVSLTNPKVIGSDVDWHDLAAAAGVKPNLGLGTQDKQVMAEQGKILADHLRSKGHDGLVVRNSAKTKWPSRIFGHDQVVHLGAPQAVASHSKIYRGEGDNIGYSAVPGVQWWSIDPEIAKKYGDVREATFHPKAKVLHLEDHDGHNAAGVDELEAFAKKHDIDFDRNQFQSMSGEEFFGQRGSPHELMDALKKHYHAIHTSNIEGPATIVLDQKALA